MQLVKCFAILLSNSGTFVFYNKIYIPKKQQKTKSESRKAGSVKAKVKSPKDIFAEIRSIAGLYEAVKDEPAPDTLMDDLCVKALKAAGDLCESHPSSPLPKIPDETGNPHKDFQLWRKWFNEADKILGQSARHSQDYRSVHWFGTDYSFTPYQAACIKILWEAWRNGTPDVGVETILEKAGSESSRLVDVFKNNNAWQKMIVSGKTKGSYRLKEPSFKK